MFSRQKFLSNQSSWLTFGMFHIYKKKKKKVAALPCQFPQCSNGRDRIDRWTVSGGQGSLKDEVWAPKAVTVGAVTLLVDVEKHKSSVFSQFPQLFPQKPTALTYFISSANPNRQRTCHFHRNPSRSRPHFIIYIFFIKALESHTRISSSSSSKKEEKLLSSSGGALKVALSVSPA